MLGAGGMGEVYHARDARLNRDVAVKVLREDDAASADNRSRFEREGRPAGVGYKLGRGAVLTGGGSEGDDLPAAVLLGEVEEIPAAVIELAIDEEVKG